MSEERSAAEIMYGRDEAQASPPEKPRIELWIWPMGHRGHAFLKLVKEDGTTEELHGRPKGSSVDGSKLEKRRLFPTPQDPSKYTDQGRRVGIVAEGSADDMAKIWERGVKAADDIEAKKFDYKAYDPSYEFGGSGGEIQNSNSAAYTMGRAMNLDLDDAVRKAGVERKLPGWGRDLLNPDYRPYKKPAQRLGCYAP